MKKLLTFILLIVSIVIGSAQTIDLRKPVRMIYGGDTLTLSFSGDTVLLYGNHGKFRISDLLKLDQLIIRDTTILDLIAEHGGGADPHITDTTIYLEEPIEGNNYFDLRLSPYDNGAGIDMNWEDNNSVSTFSFAVQKDLFSWLSNNSELSLHDEVGGKYFLINCQGVDWLRIDTTGSIFNKGMKIGMSYKNIAGTIRYNSGTSKFEGYTDSWNELGGATLFYNEENQSSYVTVRFDGESPDGAKVISVSKYNTDSIYTFLTTNWSGDWTVGEFSINMYGDRLFTVTSSGSGYGQSQFKSDVEIDGDLTYNLRHGYAEYMSDYTPDLTQNVYTKVTPGMTVIEADYLTIEGDSVTIDYPGDYWFDSNITISGSNGDDFTFQFRKNNVVIKSRRQSTTGAANYFTFSIRMYLKDLIAGDDISIWVTNTAGNGDAVINPIDIYVEKKQ